MNKAELIEKVARETGQSKAVTREVLDNFIDAVGRTLASGNKIEIRGFGSFRIKRRKAQLARNPRTGAKVEVPSRFVPSLKRWGILLEQVDKKK